MPFGFPDKFEAWPLSKLADWPQSAMPSFHADEAKKREYGIALAKEQIPFHAACSVCGQDTKAALWISTNWITDPIVVAAKDLYLKTVGLDATLLDKDQLGARLLAFADEKVTLGGKQVYVSEARDRLKALEVYAEIMGFKKSGIDNSTKNFAFTKMKIVVVEPKAKETKTIEHGDDQPIAPPKDKNAAKLKLVAV